MTTIWKYPINVSSSLVILPEDCTVINIDFDPNGVLCAWAEIDHNTGAHNMVAMPIHVVGTGQEVPEGFRHFTTIKQDVYVWHVYF